MTDAPTATAPGETDALLGAVLDLVQSFGAIKARLAASRDTDFSPVILLHKLDACGPARSGELAARLSADPSTISRQVAALVKDGLVRRQADPGDGRASVLEVTDAGRDRLAVHRARRTRAIAPIVDDWSAEDRETFTLLLRRFVAGVTEHRDQVVTSFLNDLPPNQDRHENQETPA